MSGQLLVFAGSLAGILLLFLVSLALGLGRGARIADEAEARELADNAICDFEPQAVALDAAGRGALLADGDGRILLLAPHGAQFTALLLDRAPVVLRYGSRLSVGRVTLELGKAAEAWENRLKALG